MRTDMGDYDRYRHGDDIEMGMGGERLGPRTTLGGSSSTTTNEFNSKSKRHQRTPSDPSDDLETDYQPVNWKRVLFTPKYLVLWIILIIIGVLTAVISLKHDEVVAALRPFAEKVRDIPAGWLIFVVVLFVISFPPLFGHELVALLAGVVYGLWIGFGIVAAGTFIGESEYSFLMWFSSWAVGPENDILTKPCEQSERGLRSKRSFEGRQRRWRELTSPTARWRNCAAMVASGYVLLPPFVTSPFPQTNNHFRLSSLSVSPSFHRTCRQPCSALAT